MENQHIARPESATFQETEFYDLFNHLLAGASNEAVATGLAVLNIIRYTTIDVETIGDCLRVQIERNGAREKSGKHMPWLALSYGIMAT